MNRLKLPPDFVQRMRALLKEEWSELEGVYQGREYQALRFNQLKRGLDKEQYEGVLDRLQICPRDLVPWADSAYYYDSPAHPGRHPYHEMGLYYIQEPSAMSAAALLSPMPGERVLDLCAAPGGKTTQLAACMHGEGLLIANEIHPERSRILSQNVERLGIANTVVTNETCERLAESFPAYFHRILVDAPCSGEGMFRKNPQAVTEWSPDQVKMCAERQKDILGQASRMLMPGGVMVYSTCTFSPEENEGVISDFLKEHGDFELTDRKAPYFDRGRPAWADGNEELLKAFRLFPHHLNGEGHFVAVMQRKGEGLYGDGKGGNAKKEKRFKAVLNKEQMSQLQTFTSQVLTKEMEELVLSGDLCLFGEQLYRLPEGAPDLLGLRVPRPGLQIGSFKKNRFEPAHALALFLGQEDVKSFAGLHVSDGETYAYFRGETIRAQGEKGFCLVCVDGWSAGWGKLAGDQLKNHYPKGLRKDLSE